MLSLVVGVPAATWIHVHPCRQLIDDSARPGIISSAYFPMSISRFLLFAAVALALVGCGGDGGGSNKPTPDSLAVYKSQKINWSSCHRYFSETHLSAEELVLLTELGDRVQCTDVKAPLDYLNPDGLQISLSMLRVRAADAADKKPNLFFNPGGPGGDGLMESFEFALALSNGNRESVLGRKYREVSDAYNFVGFSPRGVGASTRIICEGNELIYSVDNTKWGDSAQNIRNITDTARYIASNCQKNPVSDYIHTDATARDMDLMRHLLGDEKLHYYGISYGTWLGFWYAGIFPERIGPMVLDSSVNFSKNFHEVWINYGNGQAHAFLEYVAPYAARHDDVFGMGATPELITNDLKAIGHEVNQVLLNSGEDFRAEADDLPSYISTIKVAIEMQKLINQGKTLDEIAAILQTGEYIADEEISKVFKEKAKIMVNFLKELKNPNFYVESAPFAIDNSASVWQTVICNDEAIPTKDQVFWVDLAFEKARTLPIIGNVLARQPCIYWNRKTAPLKPSMESLKNVSLLMVHSEFDVPTPLRGALETFEKLPSANMVRVHNEGSHGLMVYGTECVDLVVMDHLLGHAPSRRMTECQGKPLPLEVEDKQSRINTVKAVAGTDPAPMPLFENPELAEKLIRRRRLH